MSRLPKLSDDFVDSHGTKEEWKNQLTSELKSGGDSAKSCAKFSVMKF